MNILECSGVKKYFQLGTGKSWRTVLKGEKPHVPMLHAVDDVSFTLGEGESIGIVGESGCGKSTLVRLITRMLDLTDGDILFRDRNIGFIPARKFAETQFRSKIQMVFQDPSDSLNPRQTAFEAIAEPLKRLALADSRSALAARVVDAALKVGLPSELLPRFPHQLSGGQKARVGIARAVVVNPALLVLDEPTAALDVSVQATILQLLADLRRNLGMSYIFVSHDLNVVRMLCDKVIVMYLGCIVEQAPAAQLFQHPAHPYTQALISAIPVIGGRPEARTPLAGEPRSPIDPDAHTCRFFGRCLRQTAHCQSELPLLRTVASSHQAACHFAQSS